MVVIVATTTTMRVALARMMRRFLGCAQHNDKPAQTLEVNLKAGVSITPTQLLINGKGPSFADNSLAELTVELGKTYLLHVINAGTATAFGQRTNTNAHNNRTLPRRLHRQPRLCHRGSRAHADPGAVRVRAADALLLCRSSGAARGPAFDVLAGRLAKLALFLHFQL